MGQDTDASIGVAVSYDMTYENLDMINNLCYQDRNDCYFHPKTHVDCEDEIVQVFEGDESIDEILEEILQAASSEEEFDELADERLMVKEIHFIKVVKTVYARNISRRSYPCIWDDSVSDIDKVLGEITKFRDEFLALGVPAEKIKIQGLMNDSH